MIAPSNSVRPAHTRAQLVSGDHPHRCPCTGGPCEPLDRVAALLPTDQEGTEILAKALEHRSESCCAYCRAALRPQADALQAEGLTKNEGRVLLLVAACEPYVLAQQPRDVTAYIALLELQQKGLVSIFGDPPEDAEPTPLGWAVVDLHANALRAGQSIKVDAKALVKKTAWPRRPLAARLLGPVDDDLDVHLVGLAPGICGWTAKDDKIWKTVTRVRAACRNATAP